MKREISKELPQYGINRACGVLNMSKNVYYYRPLIKDDSEIEEALQKKAIEHSVEGFWKVFSRLRLAGWMHDYNNYRPHDGLGEILPKKYAELNSIRASSNGVEKELFDN